MRRICIVTTGQPASNPRLVKEADALSAAGYDVTAVGAHWASWAAEMDGPLLAARSWSCQVIDWRRHGSPWRFWTSRVRHAAGRRLAAVTANRFGTMWAAHRVAPELARAARHCAADLYIAHNLGALPAAFRAASGRVPVAFDAEDFHSGQLSGLDDAALRAYTEHVERTFIPRCCYVTAASPGIAAAYAALCGIPTPPVIRNVFPLEDRPAEPPHVNGPPVRLYWFSQTIGPDRGLEDVIDAMAFCHDVPLELHLRGTWQAGYESTLRARASALGLPERAVTHHPPASPSEMVRLAARHHIGVAPEPPVSRNNDILWSNKVFTYLLAGLPVVLSRTTGQGELARELGAAAVLYPPGDGAGLAAALRPWVTDATTLRRAGSHAWALADGRYNWDLEQTRLVDLVREVLPPA